MSDNPTPPSAFDFVVRPVVAADLPDFTAYFNDLEAREPKYHGYTLESMTAMFNHHRMSYTTWYLAHKVNSDGSQGPIIGNADFGKRDGDDTAWAELNVHPDYRSWGVGRALYATLMQRAADSEAKAIRLNPHLSSTLLIDFLARRGFEQERYFWGMRLSADQSVEPPALPPSITVRSYQPGKDEEIACEAFNGAFAEHYGFEPTTVEQIQGWNERPGFKPEGLLLAFSGDEVAGVCVAWIGTVPVEGDMVGDISDLGVIPTYRRQGLGRALLIMGVNYLRQFVPIVELGVEGKNDNALALYQSVGFKQQRGWLNMVKQLSPNVL